MGCVDSMVLLKGVMIGTMYKLKGITISNGCNSSIVPDIGEEQEKTPTVSGEKVMMSHQRLGNIGEKGLQLLHGKGMIEGMSNCSLYFDLFEHCVYGKKNRVRCPSGAMREEESLQLVHSDVFGSMMVPSLRKCVLSINYIWLLEE